MRGAQSIRPWWAILLSSLFATIVQSHTILTYPGWRGNNLHTNGTVEETDGLVAQVASNATKQNEFVYPYGMQWAYPCGGMPMSQNRTKWPIKGGAVAFQPGWFFGHKTAFIYINLGTGTVPINYSLPMVPPFQLVGPTADPYPGTFCVPQVPLPKDLKVSVGDNATIQVIETAVHGAALYNCVDITFAEPEEVAEVTRDNCFNSTNITSKLVYAMDPDTPDNAAPMAHTINAGLGILPLLLVGYFGNFF